MWLFHIELEERQQLGCTICRGKYSVKLELNSSFIIKIA